MSNCKSEPKLKVQLWICQGCPTDEAAIAKLVEEATAAAADMAGQYGLSIADLEIKVIQKGGEMMTLKNGFLSKSVCTKKPSIFRS